MAHAVDAHGTGAVIAKRKTTDLDSCESQPTTPPRGGAGLTKDLAGAQARWLRSGRGMGLDLVMLLATAAFFALGALYTRACDRL